MAELLSEHRDTVAILTLNNPKRRNALTAACLQTLRARLADALDADAVRSVVLTGAGDAFCAGLDLHAVRRHLQPGRFVRPLADPHRAGEPHALDAMLTDLAAIYAAVESAGKPVVAAVNGPAVAGGAGLVACCDVTVAAQGATIGCPGIRIGLVAPVLDGPLVRRVGWGAARHLLLTGALLDAKQARACGLFHEITAPEACLARAVGLAEQLGDVPPAAFAATKRSFLPSTHDAAPGAQCTPADAPLLLYDVDATAALDRFLTHQ